MRINYRNHRKIVVIDGKIGYVGGFNVGDEYVNKGKQFKFWRDTHIRIRGEAVSELNKRFILDWDYASGEKMGNMKGYTHREEGREGKRERATEERRERIKSAKFHVNRYKAVIFGTKNKQHTERKLRKQFF